MVGDRRKSENVSGWVLIYADVINRSDWRSARGMDWPNVGLFCGEMDVRQRLNWTSLDLGEAE